MIWQALYVYGASGHGKVVAEVCIQAKLPALIGFIDDDPDKLGEELLGLPVLGGAQHLGSQAQEATIGVVLGIGDNQQRKLTAARCTRWNISLVKAVHPAADVASSAVIGAGTIVMPGAIVNPDARIGEGAIINSGAIVEHDCIIGSYSHLSPNATVGGGGIVGPSCHLGIGSVVLPNVKIGESTTIGAGAVVLEELPAMVTAVGVPARVIHGSK